MSDSIKQKLQNAKDFIKLTVDELKEIPQDVLGSLQVRECGIVRPINTSGVTLYPGSKFVKTRIVRVPSRAP